MKITKKIERLLEQREKLAMQLMFVCSTLDAWLEANGVDLTDPDISDAVQSGCMIYCEPSAARMVVEDYINTKI